MVTFNHKLPFKLNELDLLYCKKECWRVCVPSGLPAPAKWQTNTTVCGFSSAGLFLHTCSENLPKATSFGALAGGGGGLWPWGGGVSYICGDPWEEGEIKCHNPKKLQKLRLLFRLLPFQHSLCFPRGSVMWAIEKVNQRCRVSFVSSVNLRGRRHLGILAWNRWASPGVCVHGKENLW